MFIEKWVFTTLVILSSIGLNYIFENETKKDIQIYIFAIAFVCISYCSVYYTYSFVIILIESFLGIGGILNLLLTILIEFIIFYCAAAATLVISTKIMD